ncbi:hypothetical protein NMG60_11015114 [Bertholletia excelsa]
MAVVASTSSWIPEDDLLLKNSVEAGASLEALAKGAVEFSRRFTLEELRDRWHSLLYDPDVSAQASVHMVELEGSSNLVSKSGKLDKAEKRKLGSIRKQYYAMRKRIRTEFFRSADLGFLGEPNLNCSGNGGDVHQHVTLNDDLPVSMIGDCMPTRFELQQTDFDILQHAFPQTITDITAANPAVNIGDACHSRGQGSLSHNQMNTMTHNECLHGFSEDASSFLVQDALRTDVTELAEQTNPHHDNPHCLQDNSVEFEKCFEVEKMDPSQQQSDTKHFETDNSETKDLTFDSENKNVQNACSEFGGKQHFSSPNLDGSTTFHMMGFSPPLTSMPLWKTTEELSVPAMPVNMNPEPEEKRQVAEDVSELLDKDDSRTKGSSGHRVTVSGTMLTDKQNGDGFMNSTTMSDVELADLSDSLLDFSNDDILFTDVDPKEIVDKSSCAKALLLASPKHVNVGNVPNIAPKTLIASDSGGLSHSSYAPGHQKNVSHSSINKPSLSNSRFISIQNEGFTCCSLNTEDPEIPCNDDIFLLIHPAPSFATTSMLLVNIHPMEPMSSADEKDKRQGLHLTKKGGDPPQTFMPSPTAGPYMFSGTGQDHSIVRSVKTELADASCPTLAPGHKNIGDPLQCRSAHSTLNSALNIKLEKDVRKVELGIVDSPGAFREVPLHAEAGSVEVALTESAVVPSLSDQDEPESDNDIPHFSDVEAMILEMDLGAHEQDLYFSRRVSKYQSEDSKRSIIRLEQCAQSCLQRAMSSQGALAILYGRRLKHFIQKTEVILGRSTEEIDVDIDLGKEGRANKISRRQAIIKMEKDGSFSLKNLGKSSISVNGKAVGSGQLLNLIPSCLIEIRGMNFVFEINHKSVKQYLDNVTMKIQGQGNNFEQSPDEQPSRLDSVKR